MSRRIPTDAEIHAAATRLGVLDEDGQVPHNKRAQVAKAIELAASDTADQVTQTADATRFAERISQLQSALDEQGIRYETSARVLGAIAAPLWRDMKEHTAHAKSAR